MAVKLIANYAKKLGLPGYSSHQFSISVETELTQVDDIAATSERLYRQLQESVDKEMQNYGFVPPDGYGMTLEQNRNGVDSTRNSTAANGAAEPYRQGSNGNGHPARRYENGNGSHNGNGAWRCSEKQRDLIEKIVRENHLVKRDVEALAIELFGAGVTQLDRLQASGLIDELLERHGNKPRGQRQPYRREPANAQARGGEE